METIVLSGINLHSGGTLSIYYDMLDAVLKEELYKKFRFVCFVYKTDLFKKYEPYVTLIEISDSRGSYLRRLYYENIYFRKYSNKNDVYIWISVQDITPNVRSKKLFTYCHNPMMFYQLTNSDYKYGKRLILFKYFYKYVYKMHIKNNTSVIVQQDWIRKEFEKIYKINNVLVARPIISDLTMPNNLKSDITTFIFASQATFFKNFEVLCEAARILRKTYKNGFKVQLTMGGNENAYSQDLKDKYHDVEEIEWLGIVPRNILFDYYSKSDCLVFPSKLETWGLPISEYKSTNKPIILSDLPYAHETIGNYDRVAFFDPVNALQLAEIMESVINNNFSCFTSVKEKDYDNPFVTSWSEFWDYIINC